eukprot:scaffold1638_cov120-Cylindrotheca_fusiformis.AAC.7
MGEVIEATPASLEKGFSGHGTILVLLNNVIQRSLEQLVGLAAATRTRDACLSLFVSQLQRL